MKKFLAVFTVAFVCSSFCFAQEIQDSQAAAEVTLEEITVDLKTENEEEASDEKDSSAEATDEEIAYEKANAVRYAIAYNLWGFGQGSFRQGDRTGGVIGAVIGSVAATGMTGLLVTDLLGISGIYVLLFCGPDTASEFFGKLDPYLKGFGITFAAGTGAGILWGIIRPCVFRNQYNREHPQYAGTSVTILPVVSADKIGLAGVIRF